MAVHSVSCTNPNGLYVDENRTVLVADSRNSRIVEWEWNATAGRLVLLVTDKEIERIS